MSWSRVSCLVLFEAVAGVFGDHSFDAVMEVAQPLGGMVVHSLLVT